MAVLAVLAAVAEVVVDVVLVVFMEPNAVFLWLPFWLLLFFVFF